MKYLIFFSLFWLAIVSCSSGNNGDEKSGDQDSDLTTDGDTNSHGDGDVDSDSDNGIPTWLIHISKDKLWHIEITTGIATEVCDLVPEESVVLPTFQSVTFTRDDRLLASSSSKNSLWEVSLPSCDIVKIGNYSLPNLQIPGICPDKENGLYGLSTGKDSLYRIDPDTAQVTLIGDFGVSFGNIGGTWVEEESEIYSITNLSNGDGLMKIDKSTGGATQIASLTKDFGSVGMEHHPHNGKIYACTSPSAGPGYDSAPLFEVELDGTVNLVGLTGLPGNCDNLGAPWGNPELPELY